MLEYSEFAKKYLENKKPVRIFEGAYGRVDDYPDHDYVVKKMSGYEGLQEIVNQISIKHKKLIHFLDFTIQPDNCDIYVAYPKYKEIVAAIEDKDIDFVQICTDILEALCVLHKHNISHMDVKINNIMCSFSGSIKYAVLIDPGISNPCHFIHNGKKIFRTHIITFPPYFDLEMFEKEHFYQLNTDLFSLAIGIFHIISNIKVPEKNLIYNPNEILGICKELEIPEKFLILFRECFKPLKERKDIFTLYEQFVGAPFVDTSEYIPYSDITYKFTDTEREVLKSLFIDKVLSKRECCQVLDMCKRVFKYFKEKDITRYSSERIFDACHCLCQNLDPCEDISLRLIHYITEATDGQIRNPIFYKCNDEQINMYLNSYGDTIITVDGEYFDELDQHNSFVKSDKKIFAREIRAHMQTVLRNRASIAAKNFKNNDEDFRILVYYLQKGYGYNIKLEERDTILEYLKDTYYTAK